MTQPLFLGIEIGGTKLQLGLGRGDGRLVALRRLTIVPERGAEGILTQIADASTSLAHEEGIGLKDVAAVGVGFGGPLDAERGVITTSHQVKGWDGFPLADWVRQTLRVDAVSIQNDADTAGLAEARFGAGVGMSPVFYVTIGSGIGGGLILDSRIYRGLGLGAAEVGHLQIHRTGQPVDLLEHIASGWSIARAARALVEQDRKHGRPDGRIVMLAEGDIRSITTQHVSQAAHEGDRTALRVLGEAHDALAQALGHAVTLLAPRRIILGGGVSLIGETHWLEPIRRRLLENVFPPFRSAYDLVGGMLGEEVVVHGALGLASDARALNPGSGA